MSPDLWDALGDSADPPVSQHTKNEVAAVHHLGRPLCNGEPVPGCPCERCRGRGGIALWDFQERAVEELRQHIRAGKRNLMLCSPTGSGKTIVATFLVRECFEKGKRAVFVADRKALIDQTSAVFDAYEIPHGVIQADHWRWQPHQRVQVASPQTLERRKWPGPLDLIVVDEAHTVRKVTHDRIAQRDCVTIGLTATPFTKGLGQFYDAVVSVTTTDRLIREKRLCPFRAFAPSEPDMKGAKVDKFGEWATADTSKRAMPIVGDCVREYLDKANGRKFIAFGADIAHCEEIRRQFMAAGIHVELYTSHTPDDERRAILEEYRKRDSYIRGLASVAALSKGFDVQDVSCVIMARPLRKSLAEHIQILGRGLRADPDDPGKECLVLDHAGNMRRFWDDMQDFFVNGPEELDDGKKKETKPKKPQPGEGKGRKCPVCFCVHGAQPTCPACGYEYPRPVRSHRDGELVELGGGKVATRTEKQSVYSGLLWIAQQKGRKPGWARHRYAERFGAWPFGLAEVPVEPTEALRKWSTSRDIAYAKAQQKAKRTEARKLTPVPEPQPTP